MKTVPGYPHLHRREGGTYYFRRRVPDHLRAAFGREWKESLRTTEFEEAKRLCRRKGVEVDNMIRAEEAKAAGVKSPPMTPEEVRALADEFIRERLEQDQCSRDRQRNREYTEALDRELDWDRPQFREALANSDWTFVAADADAILAREGRFYGRGDESRKMMARALLAANVKLYKMLEDRQRGEVVETPAPAVRQSATSGPDVTVGRLVEAYRKDKAERHGTPWVEKRYAHIFRALEEVLGKERRIVTLIREDVREVRRLLQRVPQHAGKRYAGLSLREAADAGERDGAKLLAGKTIQSYLQNLSAMLNWAVAEKWLDTNPASGLVEKAKQEVKRRPFTADELRTLFGSLLDYREGDRAWRFWLPALAVYTGARANELCQLRAGDVQTVHGVPCIRISTFDADGGLVAENRLKTEASERTVPLHRELLDMGWQEFVEAQAKEPDGRVFSALKQGPNGGYSRDLTRWFAAQLDEVGLGSPSLVFHSFRHGFADACRLGGVDSAVRKALGGWHQAEIAETYGSKELVRMLAKAVDALDFDGFSLGAVVRGGEAKAA